MKLEEILLLIICQMKHIRIELFRHSLSLLPAALQPNLLGWLLVKGSRGGLVFYCVAQEASSQMCLHFLGGNSWQTCQLLPETDSWLVESLLITVVSCAGGGLILMSISFLNVRMHVRIGGISKLNVATFKHSQSWLASEISWCIQHCKGDYEKIYVQLSVQRQLCTTQGGRIFPRVGIESARLVRWIMEEVKACICTCRRMSNSAQNQRLRLNWGIPLLVLLRYSAGSLMIGLVCSMVVMTGFYY